MSYYKIMGSRIGNHIRVRRTWAPRGSGSGLRVRIWGSVSAGSFSDNRVDLGVPRRRTWFGVGAHRIRPGRCRSFRHEGLVGPSYRVGLGVREEELGVRRRRHRCGKEVLPFRVGDLGIRVLGELGVREGVLVAPGSRCPRIRLKILAVPTLFAGVGFGAGGSP